MLMTCGQKILRWPDDMLFNSPGILLRHDLKYQLGLVKEVRTPEWFSRVLKRPGAVLNYHTNLMQLSMTGILLFQEEIRKQASNEKE